MSQLSQPQAGLPRRGAIRNAAYAHLVTAGVYPAFPVRVAWELLEFMRESLTSLEDGATRVAAAQTAGLIALWSQLHTFENGAPEVLAWIAWVLVILAVAVLGPLITPRRLARFWARLTLGNLLAYDEPDKERALISELCESMQGQITRLRRGMTLSIMLGLTALAVAALAYALEKGFYAP